MAGADVILEFLKYVEGQQHQSVKQLLDRILYKSRLLTDAEAGTIFIACHRGGHSWLEPACMQNDAVNIRKTGFRVPIGPGTIAGYVADTGKTLRIDDVYEIHPSRPYSFDPAFERGNYKTRSMLCFPLKNYQDTIIGVVQLLNARKKRRKNPLPFPPESERLVLPIARAAGGSIERASMLENIKGKNKELRNSNRRIRELQRETEEAFQLSTTLLARAAEIHDEETGNHIVRVNEYSYFIAKKLGLNTAFCDEIRYSAQLHDVGKMSVDVAILKKQGRLNNRERAEMNRHPIYGHQILKDSPRLQMAAEIALNHHEKWDGSGYPNGVIGEAIPISARIVQLADIYDALRSKRSYKPAYSHRQSFNIITRGDDRIHPAEHFDPALVALFKREHQGFDQIWKSLRDE